MKRCLSELSRARRDLKALKQEPVPVVMRAAERGDAAVTGKENRTPQDGEEERSLQQTVADVTRVSGGGGGRERGGLHVGMWALIVLCCLCSCCIAIYCLCCGDRMLICWSYFMNCPSAWCETPLTGEPSLQAIVFGVNCALCYTE